MPKGFALIVRLPGYGKLTISPRSVEWRPSGNKVNVHRANFERFAQIVEANLQPIRSVRNTTGVPTPTGTAAAKDANVKIQANRQAALAAAKAGEPKPEGVTPLQWKRAKAAAKKYH
jgi:hypothetical protein